MGPDELEWLDISDFSPGIWEEDGHDGTPFQTAPDGAAARGTHGCIADGQNGLKGGPKLVQVHNIDATPWFDQLSYFAYFNTLPAGGVEWDTDSTAPSNPIAQQQVLLDFDVQAGEYNYPTENTRGYKYEEIEGATANIRGAGTADQNPEEAVIVGLVFQGEVHDVGADEQTLYSYINTWGIRLTNNVANRLCGFVPYFEMAEHYTPLEPYIGFGDINSYITFLEEGERGSTNTHEYWKFGAPVFAGVFGHWLDAGLWLEDVGGANLVKHFGSGQWIMGGPYTGLNRPLAIANPYFSEIPGVPSADYGETSSSMAFTHSVPHGQRFVAIAVPTSDTDYSVDDGQRASGYIEQGYQSGQFFWDPDYEYSLTHNSTLQISQQGVIERPDTGNSDDAAMLSLGANGLVEVHTLVSINASRLFILTTNNGAIVADGEITNPNLSSLPSVESTYGETSRPVPVAGGVAYCSRSGVFLWDGGEQSQHLSPQLRGDFWSEHHKDKVAATGIDFRWASTAPRGRMAYRWPYLYCPGGWIYNMETQGWWRIDNGVATGGDNGDYELPLWRVDGRGRIWAMNVTVTDADLDPAGEVGESFDGSGNSSSISTWPLMQFDQDQESPNWVWISQPISVSRNRSIEIREVALTLQAPTNATITLVVGDHNGYQTTVNIDSSNLSSTYLKTITVPVNATGTNLFVGLSTSCPTEGDSVRLRRLSVGWRAAERIRITDGQA